MTPIVMKVGNPLLREKCQNMLTIIQEIREVNHHLQDQVGHWTEEGIITKIQENLQHIAEDLAAHQTTERGPQAYRIEGIRLEVLLIATGDQQVVHIVERNLLVILIEGGGHPVLVE